MTGAEATLTAENCPQMDAMTILTISQTVGEIEKDLTTDKMWDEHERTA